MAISIGEAVSIDAYTIGAVRPVEQIAGYQFIPKPRPTPKPATVNFVYIIETTP
jgi:hypothetical protein